jgi:alpha-glucosidase
MTNDHSYSHPTSPRYRWPDGAIVYQIYPRSLADANGDGVGDLQGITSKLEYLKSFGVNAIWLSPFYPSPMVDFGYDISDYRSIDPIFGTMDDFKALLAAAHRHGIKVMVDLVVNHTSDKHAWFEESRSSRDNPKADWYIWRNARIDEQTGDRLPPNNWRDALVGDSAWEWDDTRQQYYMHSWHAAQPDLNWANKRVRNAIKDIMRFWLDLGVDGFRADAVDWMAKDPLFRDDPPNPDYDPTKEGRYDELLHTNSKGWPTEYAYLSAMTSVFEEPPYAQEHRFMVAETYQERHNPADAYIAFYGGIDPEVAAPFNFEGLYLDWDAAAWRQFLIAFHGGLHSLNPMSIPSYAFGNHDNPRLATRIGDAAARSAALMQLTLPGMIFVYYGEEIGMHDAQLHPEDMQDVYFRSRDPARTPMQWSPDVNAGFSPADRTWLPVASDYQTVNVATESDDMYSFLSLYRTLGRLRNTSGALRYGGLEVLDMQTPDVLGYIRRSDEGEEAYLILVNFSAETARCRLDRPVRQLLLSSDPKTQLGRRDESEGMIELLPNEAALFIC